MEYQALPRILGEISKFVLLLLPVPLKGQVTFLKLCLLVVCLELIITRFRLF